MYKVKTPKRPSDPACKGKKRKAATRTIPPKAAGQKPIKYTPGALHRATGTPKGQTIPKSKLRAALAGKYGAAAKRKAEMAVNVFHVSTK